MDIFQIDWIYVDTIIIVLLIIALILVRFFKEISRWRWSSKINELRKLKISSSNINLVNTLLEIKKVELTQLLEKPGRSMDNEVNVIILNSHFTIRKRIIKLMIEGLATRGYNVIYVKLRNFPKIKEIRTLEQYQDDLKTLLSKILGYFIKNNYIYTRNFYTLIFWESIVNHFLCLNNYNNKKLISINPKIKNRDLLADYQDFQTDSILNDKLQTIFSRFSIAFIKNLNIKRFNSLNNSFNINKSPIILEKSRSSFKNYETIFLEKLIFSIEGP